MSKRQIVTIFCVLAYTIVFAHSVIPHSHHCLGHENHEEQSHIHDFGHCEELNTFIITSLNTDFQHFAPVFIHHLSDNSLLKEDHGHKICLDLNSHFRDHSRDFFCSHSTRAP